MDLNWRELLKDAGRDPEAVRNVWELAKLHEPDNDGLRRRIEAQGRDAKKYAARIAAEAAPAPAPQPAPQTSELGERYDPAEEERAFVRDVTSAVLDRSGLELTQDQALAALAVWRDAVAVGGQPWHYVWSPGWSVVVLGRWLAARYGKSTPPTALSTDSPAWEAAHDRRTLRYLGWLRPDRCPTEGATVVEYDVTAQYLAAMRSARLGDGEPTVFEGGQLAAWPLAELVKRPGWLRLASAPDLTNLLPPHAAAAFATVTAGWSLPTPLAAYLVRDHGLVLDIDRAIIWDRRTGRDGREVHAFGPRLAKIAEEIATNRQRLTELAGGDPEHPASYALALLKDVYARFASGFLRSTQHNVSEYLRPDWADMIAATASANSLRALDRAHAGGWEPVGQALDSVWFVVGCPPEDVPALVPSGLELSTQPGKWHLNRWGVATTELVTAAHRRYPTRVSQALEAIDTNRRRALEAAPHEQ